MSGIGRWLQFTWVNGARDIGQPQLADRFALRHAETTEKDVVHRVVFNSFQLDSSWSRYLARISPFLSASHQRAFDGKPPHCVVLLHGSRIIGASLLDPVVDADSHLASGPCVLIEYRSRGLGSALLAASLQALHESGIHSVRAITPEGSSAAKHVYPKFGSVVQPVDFSMAEAER